MSAMNPVIKIGTASANAVHAADLGKIITHNGKMYRMCKAAAAIATCAGMVLVSAVDSDGLRTWVVNTTTTANNALVAGVVPSDQVGSTGGTGLVSGDYFYLQVSGDAMVLTKDTSAVGEVLATSTTAGAGGEIGDETTFLQTELGAAFAVVLKTYSTGSGVTALNACRLINLV